jgi:hypothetical protein
MIAATAIAPKRVQANTEQDRISKTPFGLMGLWN